MSYAYVRKEQVEIIEIDYQGSGDLRSKCLPVYHTIQVNPNQGSYSHHTQQKEFDHCRRKLLKLYHKEQHHF